MARPQAREAKQWLQLLSEQGVASVRLRTYQNGDQPTAENFGTATTPRIRIVAILNRRSELLMPGAKFSFRDPSKLVDYLERIGTDGVASVTAGRGLYGLTEEEFTGLFQRLSQPMPSGLLTKKEVTPKLSGLIEQLNDPLRLPMDVDPQVVGALEIIPDGYEEVIDLARGTAMAALLRAEGLAMQPQSKPGQPVILRIANQTNADLSKLKESKTKDAWPIGYSPEGSPRETFPKLFERIDVEIDGYSLAEAVGAVGAQLEGLPIVWDRFALRSNGITPETLQVKLAKTRTYYKRILDKLLFQARLKGELRVDETGQPFYWITK